MIEEEYVEFSFLSHSILEYPDEDPANISPEDPTPNLHSQSPSIVVKDQKHTYKGLLGLQASPRNSNVYINLSSDSGKMRASLNSKRVDMTNPFKDIHSRKEQVFSSILQITKLYCCQCGKVVPTLLKVMSKDQSIWRSLVGVIGMARCCNFDLHRQGELVYLCTVCSSVLARLKHK